MKGKFRITIPWDLIFSLLLLAIVVSIIMAVGNPGWKLPYFD